jgi:hypothetical protein
MRKHLDPWTANVGLSISQKKYINNFSFAKKDPPEKFLSHKERFWCPFKKIWYVASPLHKTCLECGGDHEIITFDPKIHEL